MHIFLVAQRITVVSTFIGVIELGMITVYIVVELVHMYEIYQPDE